MTPVNFLDLSGQKFGRLLVVNRAEDKPKWRVRWNCTCECGGNTVVYTDNLRRGNTTSCGCVADEKRKTIRKTHGMRDSTEYTIWSNMLSRCTNPKSVAYKNYGARGIAVCERWLTFQYFYADMGARPAGTTLERIDNNKGYAPDNCVWASKSAQAMNRRTCKMLTAFGETKNEKLWAKDSRCAVSYPTFRRRIALGWEAETALVTPNKKQS